MFDSAAGGLHFADVEVSRLRNLDGHVVHQRVQKCRVESRKVPLSAVTQDPLVASNERESSSPIVVVNNARLAQFRALGFQQKKKRTKSEANTFNAPIHFRFRFSRQRHFPPGEKKERVRKW